MNEGSIQSMSHPSVGPIHETCTRTQRSENQGEGTLDNWQLLFHEQLFVLMSINKTGVQLNEANEEAPHSALLV